jgi:branched-chain amino acid transport system permease protein
MSYALHLLVTFEIFAVVAIGLNILVGKAGLLSLATAGFFAVGAYGYALLAIRLGLPAFLAIPMAVTIAVLVSVLLWIPSLRLKGDFYVLATLAVQACIYAAMHNWYSADEPVGTTFNLTNGPLGLAGIPGIAGKAGGTSRALITASMASVILASCAWIVRRVDLSLWGRALECMRDDELVTRSIGKSVKFFKFEATALACGFAGCGGAMYAAHVGFIDPSSASLDESILLLSMVLIGGAGRLRGPLAGALLLVLLPEVLRWLGLQSALAANIRVALYGVLLVLVAHYRPQGLFGGRT